MSKRKTKAVARRKKSERSIELSSGCANEIGGVLLVILVLGLFISLASYSADDPPNSTRVAADNLCGTYGAYIAAQLMFAFGYSSYLVIAWVAMAAYRRFQAVTWPQRTSEVLGFVLGILSLSFLLSRGPGDMSGGLLGDYLALKGQLRMGLGGSILLALGGLLCALILTTRLSLRSLLMTIGSGTSKVMRGSIEAGGMMASSFREHLDARKSRFRPAAGERLSKRLRPVTDNEAGGADDLVFRRPEKPKILKPEPAPVEREKVVPFDEVQRRRQEKKSIADSVGPEAAAADPAQEDNFEPPAYELPPLEILSSLEPTVAGKEDDEGMHETAALLESTLASFDIKATVKTILPGPVVTLYELQPAPGVSVSKFTNRQDDLKLALAAKSIRIVAPIPGKSVVGIEVPNPERTLVSLKEIMQTRKYQKCTGLLKVALGKDIAGEPQYLELNKMPHLLIAGQTGSGKSVCIHSLITSLLFNAAPHQLKFIIVDPKMVELQMYAKIPHLWTPVINDVKEATKILKYLTVEMDQRYATLLGASCRDISRYNEKQEAAGQRPMPYIVVIIDELGDLMAVGAQECEGAITRLAAKARAVGIHLVLATQRPSVDVITGLIKANLPARIAFQVLARVDSRTILDRNGADTLLGDGDMLYQDPASPNLIRMQGAFIEDADIEAVTKFVEQQGEPQFEQAAVKAATVQADESGSMTDEDWEHYDGAKEAVLRYQRGSIAMLQKLLKVSHPRAVRLMEQLEQDGVVGAGEHGKARKVLYTYKEYFGESLSGVDEPDSGFDDEN